VATRFLHTPAPADSPFTHIGGVHLSFSGSDATWVVF